MSGGAEGMNIQLNEAERGGTKQSLVCTSRNPGTRPLTQIAVSQTLLPSVARRGQNKAKVEPSSAFYDSQYELADEPCLKMTCCDPAGLMVQFYQEHIVVSRKVSLDSSDHCITHASWQKV